MISPENFVAIRRLLWIYFWLIILEGALRKWIFPGLSNPLLLIRDPIALLIIMLALPLLNRYPWKQWLEPLLWIGALSIPLSLVFGHGDFFVTLYGARVFLLHLPLIFVFPCVFGRTDVIRFAWVIAWIAVPMTLLITAQSSAPSTHILNIAPGGEGSSAFSGALDRLRPSGTFSFVSGVAAFYPLAASAFFSLSYEPIANLKQKIFLIAVAIALVVALPVSISRSLFAGYLQVFVATLVALLLSRTKPGVLFFGLIFLAVAVAIASSFPITQETFQAFSTRWQEAAAVESTGESSLQQGVGLLQGRVLSSFTAPLSNLLNFSIFGLGTGIASNVGAQRLAGQLIFLVGENSWGAILGELGLILGILFIVWRVRLSLYTLRLALLQASHSNRIPLILCGASFMLLLNGQLTQPTNVGFIVLTSGLTLVSCNCRSKSEGSPFQ